MTKQELTSNVVSRHQEETDCPTTIYGLCISCELADLYNYVHFIFCICIRENAWMGDGSSIAFQKVMLRLSL